MKVFRTADQNALCKRRRLHKCGGEFLMPLFTRSLYRAGLIGGAALALTFAPMYAGAPQGTTQTTPSTQTEGTRQNPNPDLTNGELASMDQFLDNHEDIERDLRANPSLVNDQNYLNRHTELKSFLNAHPQIRDQFTENPTYFMNRENEREGRRGVDRDRNVTNQDRDRDRSADRDQNREGNAQNPNPDLTNGELGSMDQFLDDHKGIDKDLRANPSLVNNQKYLSRHKELQSFLNAHPQIRDQFTENPSFFMNRENQLEGTNRDVDRRDRDRNVTDRDRDRDRNFTDRDQDRDRDANQQNPNPDLRNWELARMDQFLDDHQPIEKDLTANPSLINDQKYLAHHKDLQLFLNDHPQVREEFAENPTFFMNRKNRFETSARDRDQDRDRTFTDRDRDRDRDANGKNPNPDLKNGELARMDQFLDDHHQIDKQLTAKPSLINDQKYLAQHQDLKLFLNDHPQVREEFAENPTHFMHRENRWDSGHGRTDQHAPVKTKKPVKPAKTPIEQHETTTPAAPTH